MGKSFDIHSPVKASQLESYTNESVVLLIEMLHTVDSRISECANLLNKSQPILHGKVGILFGGVQKLGNGIILIEPYRVRLCQQKNGNGLSRWVSRRISKTEFLLKKKTANFLVKGTRYARKGIDRVNGVNKTMTPENYKVSVAACNQIDELFQVRDSIKKEISSFNSRRHNLSKTFLRVNKSSVETIMKQSKRLAIDFSNPSVAYKKISEKIRNRSLSGD